MGVLLHQISQRHPDVWIFVDDVVDPEDVDQDLADWDPVGQSERELTIDEALTIARSYNGGAGLWEGDDERHGMAAALEVLASALNAGICP
jgi:hypothetical protein